MAKCDVCGNDYDKTFQITQQGRTQTFDSFECAIHAIAPTCTHCSCRIVGHGVEEGGKIYCLRPLCETAGRSDGSGPRVNRAIFVLVCFRAGQTSSSLSARQNSAGEMTSGLRPSDC